MNSPEPCKQILSFPNDEMAYYAIASIIKTPEYLNAPNFRTQWLFLKMSQKNLGKKSRLTYDQIGS